MASAEADPLVQEHQMRTGKVCDFEKPFNLEEFKQVFSEFEAIAWDEWDQLQHYLKKSNQSKL